MPSFFVPPLHNPHQHEQSPRERLSRIPSLHSDRARQAGRRASGVGGRILDWEWFLLLVLVSIVIEGELILVGTVVSINSSR